MQVLVTRVTNFKNAPTAVLKLWHLVKNRRKNEKTLLFAFVDHKLLLLVDELVSLLRQLNASP